MRGACPRLKARARELGEAGGVAGRPGTGEALAAPWRLRSPQVAARGVRGMRTARGH